MCIGGRWKEQITGSKEIIKLLKNEREGTKLFKEFMTRQLRWSITESMGNAQLSALQMLKKAKSPTNKMNDKNYAQITQPSTEDNREIHQGSAE